MFSTFLEISDWIEILIIIKIINNIKFVKIYTDKYYTYQYY